MDQALAEPGKESKLRARFGGLRTPQKNEVDIGAVVELAPAELSQGEDGKPVGNFRCRDACGTDAGEFAPGVPERREDDFVGQAGEARNGRLERPQAYDVEVGDFQKLSPLEFAQLVQIAPLSRSGASLWPVRLLAQAQPADPVLVPAQERMGGACLLFSVR